MERAKRQSQLHASGEVRDDGTWLEYERSLPMKKTRGGRMTAAKKRAAKSPGGKGPVKKRKAGRRIMST
jgi:hypothetical protein